MFVTGSNIQVITNFGENAFPEGNYGGAETA
jgi:hypothetical protein